MKNALIIGGTTGIGFGMANELIKRDVKVTIVGRRSMHDDRFSLINVDIKAPGSTTFILHQTSIIKFDYVIFSAATEEPLKDFPFISESEYHNAFSLNLNAPFFITQALVNNHRLNPKARVLFLTSRLSSSPERGSLIYCMTKSALEIFSTGLNKELSPLLISSSIIPGVVDTEMQARLRSANEHEFHHAAAYKLLQPKLRSVEEIAIKIITHLCESTDHDYAQQRVNLSETI